MFFFSSLEGSKERYVFVTFMVFFFVPMTFWLQTNTKKPFILFIQFKKKKKITKIFWINTLTRNIHSSMANTTNEKYNHNDKWNWFCHVSLIFPLYNFASCSDVFVIYLSVSRQSIFDFQNMYIFAKHFIHIFPIFIFFRCNATFYTLES